jgi:formate dehydrogenase iron-sulfur subunit
VIVYVPEDSAALSVGADEVASAIAQEAARRGLDVDLRRNGSRGLYWAEPMVEVVTPAGRVAYGPVAAGDVPGLFEAGFLDGGEHALGLGRTEEIPYLARQERVTFQRCGLIEPLSPDDYAAHGGWLGLRRALSMTPSAIVEAVTASGLRGRGGAGFPAGLKWRTVLEQPEQQKYIVCNADEGDAGTYADRMLMEGDPFSLIEGMAIAGIAVGATQGYIYIRSEYPDAFASMQRAIAMARQEGYLGPSVAGSQFAFDLDVRLGAGAYICGEETALLESLEGKKGVIRPRPPHPPRVGHLRRPPRGHKQSRWSSRMDRRSTPRSASNVRAVPPSSSSPAT